MNLQHLPPDPSTIIRVFHRSPSLVQVHQTLGRFHIHRLPRRTACLVILPPFRPGEKHLIRGRKVAGRRVGLRNAIVPTKPDRGHGHTRKHPIAQNIAVQRAHDQLHTQIAPGVGDDGQRVFNLLPFACRLDHKFHRTAIGQQANAGFVPRRQTHFIEHGIGGGRIIKRPARQVVGIKERAFGQRRHAPFLAQTEIKGAVDHPTINAHRQGTAKARIADHIAPDRVSKVQVRIDGDLARGPIGPKQGFVRRAIRLALFQDRHVTKVEAPRLQVAFARVGFRSNKARSDNPHLDHIDIGQLHAARVHPVEIGVPDKQRPRLATHAGGFPRLQGGQLVVVEFVHIIELIVQRRPAPDPLAVDQLFHLFHGVEVHMELFEVMRRAVDEGRAGPGQRLQEHWIGLRERDLDRMSVGKGHRRHFTARAHDVGRAIWT
mmetsp:Transcript_29562/g.58116  ORF Transcript_29562/g.58116 Transcript_29562/m.58116 type:complete len:432 (-) Transcript_29562:519-1814(-)